jgi:hypothetical protein
VVFHRVSILDGLVGQLPVFGDALPDVEEGRAQSGAASSRGVDVGSGPSSKLSAT